MRLLLDTQIWLWSLVQPERLGREVVQCLTASEAELFLSAASCWEIAIKYQIGRLPLPEPPERFIAPRLVRDGITALAVEVAHATRVATLPPLHRDPFDRLLVAQSQIERLTLVSADAVFERYEVNLIRG